MSSSLYNKVKTEPGSTYFRAHEMPSLIKNLRRGVLPPPPAEAIAKALNTIEIEIAWLAGDGSDRCYYRIKNPSNQKTYVLMQLSGSEAIALQKDGYEWIDIASLLVAQSICIPKVIATMPNYAALIIEDYGNQMLESLADSVLNNGKKEHSQELDGRYLDAITTISNFLKIEDTKDHVWSTRAFDKERLSWELHFFKDKYLEPIARINLRGSKAAQFEVEVAALSHDLSQYSNYFVHRDYHSRNLMLFKEHLAVIDFQDARLGPPAYDLVSLIFDSYVSFSKEARESLLQKALKIFETNNGIEVAREIKDSWKVTLIHRQLKAIGSFGYLTLEKNKGNYLKYVPLAANVILEHANVDKYPLLSQEIPSQIQNFLKV